METTSTIAIRKVCSNQSLYNYPSPACQRNFGEFTLTPNSKELEYSPHGLSDNTSLASSPQPPPPPPFLSAVILLNSPSNGKWEFMEYQRLYKLYRSSRASNVTTEREKINSHFHSDDVSTNYHTSNNTASHNESSSFYCYFICADGAYEAMCTYFTSISKEHTNKDDDDDSNNDNNEDDDITIKETTHNQHLQTKECDTNTVNAATASNSGNSKKKNNEGCRNYLPLCDVVIGDMDSCDRSKLHPRAVTTRQHGHSSAALNDAQHSHSYIDKTQLKWYDTVETIPEEVLEAIHTKIRDEHKNSNNSSGTNEDIDSDVKCSVCEPIILPVKCQMTTDFQKCVLLLRRLKHAFPSDFGLTHDENNKLEQLALSCANEEAATPSFSDDNNTRCTINSSDNFVPKSYNELYLQCTEMVKNELHRSLFDYSAVNDENEKVALQKEEARCKTLLAETISECTIDVRVDNKNNDDIERKCCNSSIKTVILPNIAVLGALGGRFDHEMVVASCLLRFAKDFHLMVTNRSNVMFACWPDGITQWLPRGVYRLTPASTEILAAAPKVDTTDKSVTNQIICSDSAKEEEIASHLIHKEDDKPADNNSSDADCFNSDVSDLRTSSQRQGAIDQIKNVQVTCGVIPYGEVAEMETTGLVWNIVNGRPDKCDDVTQTSSYRFRFDEIVSACNIVRDDVVTIDLRVTSARNADTKYCQFKNERTAHTMKSTHNPPTIFTS